MQTAAHARKRLAPRWSARLALVAGTAAVVVLLLFAGFQSLLLVGVGLAGLVTTAAGVWWALARTGPARALAAVLACAAPVAVSCSTRWPDCCGSRSSRSRCGCWPSSAAGPRWPATVDRLVLGNTRSPPPARPFLIMNPRSGGGKVGTFHLEEKAKALGAQVAVLDPDHRQDVAALARQAADEGADLLGVAGGDGTQALVAGVAAERASTVHGDRRRHPQPLRPGPRPGQGRSLDCAWTRSPTASNYASTWAASGTASS